MAATLPRRPSDSGAYDQMDIYRVDEERTTETWPLEALLSPRYSRLSLIQAHGDSLGSFQFGATPERCLRFLSSWGDFRQCNLFNCHQKIFFCLLLTYFCSKAHVNFGGNNAEVA
jgi:hypothetical protein